jgi:hypothetical protein
MTIQEIKQVANINGTLALVRQFSNDDAKTPQPWVSHWDNDKRVRVTMHDDVLAKLKTDATFAGLAVKKEDVPAKGERAAYVRFVVITPKNIEATF